MTTTLESYLYAETEYARGNAFLKLEKELTPFCIGVCRRNGIPYTAVLEEGLISLSIYNALRNYDPDKGEFTTLLASWVVGVVYKNYNATVPKGLRKSTNPRVTRLWNAYKADPHATPEQLEKVSGCSPYEVKLFLAHKAPKSKRVSEEGEDEAVQIPSGLDVAEIYSRYTSVKVLRELLEDTDKRLYGTNQLAFHVLIGSLPEDVALESCTLEELNSAKYQVGKIIQRKLLYLQHHGVLP